MGHDVHFLERVTARANPEHQAMALALYRDPQLIQHIAHSFAPLIYGEADRMALALEDGGQGPHVIVTKQGKFVTCLGEGMHVGDTPVISRALWVESSAWRHRMLAHDPALHSDTISLLARLCEEARAPSAAESRQIEALGALYVGYLMNEIMQIREFTRELTNILRELPHAARRDRRHEELNKTLRIWYAHQRHARHCVVFLLMVLPQCEPLWRDEIEKLLDDMILDGQSFTRLVAGTVWSMWSMYHKPGTTLETLMEGVRRELEGQDSMSHTRGAYSGALLLYGLEHPEQRAECVERGVALLKGYKLAEDESPRWFNEMGRVFLRRTLYVLSTDVAALPIVERIEQLSKQPHVRWQSWHKALREEARRGGGDVAQVLWLDTERIYNLYDTWILWAYLPDLAHKDIHTLWSGGSKPLSDAEQVRLARQLYTSHMKEAQMTRTELARQNKPAQGRNEPCACGSGKKYKRCCGQGADEEG